MVPAMKVSSAALLVAPGECGTGDEGARRLVQLAPQVLEDPVAEFLQADDGVSLPVPAGLVVVDAIRKALADAPAERFQPGRGLGIAFAIIRPQVLVDLPFEMAEEEVSADVLDGGGENGELDLFTP